jgi:hypothetical protein
MNYTGLVMPTIDAMASVMMCSAVILLLMGWMRRVNANDLKDFEKELAEDLEGASRDRIS